MERGEAADHRAAESGAIPLALELGLFLIVLGYWEEVQRAWEVMLDRESPAPEIAGEAARILGSLAAERGQPAEAERWWRRAAEFGEPSSQVALAQLLDQGGRVEEAERLWRQAAALGDVGATLELAARLEAAGDPEAEEWWGRAAQAGVLRAIRRYGELLVARGAADGVAWLDRAAEHGDIVAMRLLIRLFTEIGSSDDASEQVRAQATSKRIEWIRRAAEAGDEEMSLLAHELLNPKDAAPSFITSRLASLVGEALTLYSLPSAADFAAPEELSAGLAVIGDEGVIRRAAYFATVEARTQELISNPFEFMSSELGPSHPWPSSQMETLFRTFGFNDDLVPSFGAGKLSVLSPELVGHYTHGALLGIGWIREFYRPKPEGVACYLFDPLYGVLMWPEGGRIRHAVLSGHFQRRPRPSLPKSVTDRIAEYDTDALREGSILADTLFGAFLRRVVPGAYRSPAIPEVRIERPSQLLALANLLAIHCRVAGAQLWFRGQSQDYLIPDRSYVVARGVALHCSERDSSLVPAVYRKIDEAGERLEDHERLVRDVLEWNLHAQHVLGSLYIPRAPSDAPDETAHAAFLPWESTRRLYDGFGNLVATEVRDWDPGLRQVQKGLVLQHYGCPTGWIDITSDPLVALWFAMNACVADAGELRFEPYQWSGSDPSRWPTIHVFPLLPDAHPVLDTGTLLKRTEALRPQRQRCGLLGAASNLTRNYAARLLALKIRLKPGFGPPPPFTAEQLFPGPNEDKVLGMLLASDALRDNQFPVSRLG